MYIHNLFLKFFREHHFAFEGKHRTPVAFMNFEALELDNFWSNLKKFGGWKKSKETKRCETEREKSALKGHATLIFS